MSMIARNDVSTPHAPAAYADALVVVHGRSVGCKFELRRRQITIGGGAGDDARLEGLAPCVARLDRNPDGWWVTCLAGTLEIAIDGRDPTMRAPLPAAAELWIHDAILRLVGGGVEAYHDVLFRISTVDAVMGVANHRWWRELVARDRARAARADVPLSIAMLRVVGIGELVAERGAVAAHRRLRAIAERVRQELGDRPIGRIDGCTLAVLLEGNLDARYPFVDALRRAAAEIGGLELRAAIADLPQTSALTDLEGRALTGLERAESAEARGPVVVD